MTMVAEAPATLDLSDVSTDDIAQLADAVRSGTLPAPLTATALELSGLGYLTSALAPIRMLDRAAVSCVLEAIRAERRRSRSAQLDLVWSGTDAGPSHARYTQIVIPELIAKAQRTITIAGYSFDHGSRIFPALHEAISTRNVRVRLFVDIQQLAERLEQQLKRERRWARLLPVRAAKLAGSDFYTRAIIELFLDLHWPFLGQRPELFYDPRTALAKSNVSLHAKCVVVDNETSLVTSANFTDRGQTRNIEVGALIHDKGYATALERQWNALVESGGVTRG